MPTSGPSYHGASLMNLGRCLPLLYRVVQTQLLEGLGKKLVWMLDLMGTACLLLSTIYTVSFTSPTWCMFASSPSTTLYVKCKLLCLEKLTCFYFTPHWLRLHTSGTDFQNFMNIILFHTDQDFGKKHCLILWIPFLLFQELLCCSERPFALPAYSANQNIVHSHFTPFPLVSPC